MRDRKIPSRDLPTLSPLEIEETYGDRILNHTKKGDLVSNSQLARYLNTAPQTVDYILKHLTFEGYFVSMGLKNITQKSGRKVKSLVYRRTDKTL